MDSVSTPATGGIEKRSTARAPDVKGIERRASQWYGRVSLPDGQRPWVPFGPATGPEAISKRRAAETRAAMIELGQRTGKLVELVARARANMAPRRGRINPLPGAINTVRQLGEAWTSGELYERHGAVNRLRPVTKGNVDKHRLGPCYAVRPRGERGPTFGEMLVVEVTDRDVERVLADAPKGDAAQGTRERYYSMLRRFFDLAIMPARLRTDSPVSKYMRPSGRRTKLFSYLYPTELFALLKLTTIPLGRRVLYALAVYTGLRKSTLLAIRWQDVDLQHGTLLALVTKNRVPQLFEIEPTLRGLLARWRAYCGEPAGDAAVVTAHQIQARWRRSPKTPWRLGEKAAAEILRADLRAAGVTREVLFLKSDKIEPLRFHDLRATFVTWAKRAGKGEGWITDRTGHLDPDMLARYARAARVLEDLKLEPFPSLDSAIPELSKPLSTPPRNGPLGPDGEGGSTPLGPNPAASALSVEIVAPVVAGSSPVTHPEIIQESAGALSEVDNEVDNHVESEGSIRERRESAGRLLEEAARLVRAGLGSEAQGVARTAFALLMMRDPPDAKVIAIETARARRPDDERDE